MNYNAFEIVRRFETEVAYYTNAPYCVAVNSCTNALFLCLRWHHKKFSKFWGTENKPVSTIDIPKRTYISVPMQIKHAGWSRVSFRAETWSGAYQLRPLPIFDSARRFTKNMYDQFEEQIEAPFVCTSHHWSKTLGIQQGGCILHHDAEFDAWARRARFDGRTEGVAPRQDQFTELGWHMYMSPEVAAEGLVRLMHLPDDNPDLPCDDYPDLSKLELFK